MGPRKARRRDRRRAVGHARLHGARGDRAGSSTLGFSPDGAFVASIPDSDNLPRIWRVPSGEHVVVPGEQDWKIDGERHSIAFMTDHRAAIVSGAELSIVDLESSKTLAARTLPSSPYDIADTRDGIAAALGTSLVIWNPVSDELRELLPTQGDNLVELLAISRDGESIMSCSRRRRLLHFELAKSMPRQVSSDERCFREGFTFSPDGNSFASLGLNGEVRLHMLHEHTMRRFLGHAGAIRDVTFSSDGALLASAGTDHTVRIWELHETTGVFHDVHWLDRVSANGRLLVRSKSKPDVLSVLADPPTTKTSSFMQLRDAPTTIDGCMSRDGMTVAVYGADQVVTIYDLKDDTRRTLPAIPTLSTDDEFPTSCSSAGRELVQVNSSGEVRTIDLTSGTARKIAKLPSAGIAAMYSHDDRRVAVATKKGYLAVLDASTGKERWGQDLCPTLWTINWSRDDRKIAASCDDGVIRVIDLDTTRVHSLRGHVGSAASAAFFPDGRRLLTSGVDGTIRVWDLATERSLIVKREPSPIAGLHFIGDTSTVVYRCRDVGMVRVWDASGVPEPDMDPDTLRRWKANLSTAVVDKDVAISP